MIWLRRCFPAALTALFIGVVPPVGAQPAPSSDAPTTTTSAPVPEPGPTTIVEGSDTSTTTSTDPGAGEVVEEGNYTAQPTFDPGSAAVDRRLVASAKNGLADATAALAGAELRLAEALRRDADLHSVDAELDESRRATIERAARIERKFRERMADAYIRGDDVGLDLASLDDLNDWSVARTYIAAVRDADVASIEEIRALRASLDDESIRLAGDLGSSAREVAGATADRDAAAGIVADRTAALAAYEARSRIYVAGFVFPVVGPASFIDSWGFARMPGTPDAHWHEGTDIMVPDGTPLVACETGVVDQVSANRLGGLSVWILGGSGTRYYYAHLSAYVDGLVAGQPVAAGDPVGYAGSSGNAQGGSPHLHFEVHPDGGAAVNPFPLLQVTYRG